MMIDPSRIRPRMKVLKRQNRQMNQTQISEKWITWNCSREFGKIVVWRRCNDAADACHSSLFSSALDCRSILKQNSKFKFENFKLHSNVLIGIKTFLFESRLITTWLSESHFIQNSLFRQSFDQDVTFRKSLNNNVTFRKSLYKDVWLSESLWSRCERSSGQIITQICMQILIKWHKIKSTYVAAWKLNQAGSLLSLAQYDIWFGRNPIWISSV